MKLLCLVGKSPLVIPEAWFFDRENIKSVHAISTDLPNDDFDPIAHFFNDRNISFTLTRIRGIVNPTTSTLNEQFEEALLRWAFYKAQDEEKKPYFCLSGGTNLMVSSMYKAATIIGASEVFQVMVHPHPKDIQEVLEADNSNNFQFAKMGATVGWPALNLMQSLFTAKEEEGEKPYIKYQGIPSDKKFRNYIHQITSQALKMDSPGASRLPFNKLQLLPDSYLKWLNQPLEDHDQPWVESLPKIELHCHLGGFATWGPLLEEVRNAAYNKQKLPSVQNFSPPDGWPTPKTPIYLEDYMRLGDNTGSTLLMDEGCLRKHLELLYESFASDGVLYGEIRCSPQNYAKKMGKSSQYVLDVIKDQLSQARSKKLAKGEFAPWVNLLIIATRKEGGDLSDISRHLALAIVNKREKVFSEPGIPEIVGVDLAGYESKETRASYYQADFIGVHRCGIAVTAHAGENDDAEGIWQAVYSLHTRRLGHALRLEEAPDLKRAIIERNIGIEMCPFANYQIKGFSPMPNSDENIRKDYPLLKYLRAGVKASVNTDNIGISQASLTENFMFLKELCPGITRLEVLQLIRNGLETAFLSFDERQLLLEQMENIVLDATLTKIKF